MQCRGNLCNVGVAFAATGYYKKINWSKIKTEKWCCADDIALGFFLGDVVWRFLGNIARSFYPHKVFQKVLRQHWTGFFLVQRCLGHIGQHCTRFLPVQCRPKSIMKTKLNRIFPVHCCYEPQGQHCIGFSPVQFCSKSIKTTWNRIFSCEILYGVSWATLHKAFPV